MESAPPRNARRRPRRGSIERPINTRLARTASLVLVLPLLLVGFTVASPGPLPLASLPLTFDGATATRLARDLARYYPARVPGTQVSARAATWYRQQMSLYGLPVRVDLWKQEVPGLGVVELRNLVTVIPGQTPSAIAILAHRDSGVGVAGANDNASGTAALIELARPFTRGTGGGEGVTPLHTLVFVSTDAGAYGAAGARRFVRSTLGRTVVAAVAIDGISGRARPVVDVGGAGGRSPAPSLVRTIVARTEAAVPGGPRRSGFLQQIVGLGLHFGYGEQAAILDSRVSAVRLGTAGNGVPGAATDEADGLRQLPITQLGGALAATLGSLNQAAGLRQSTHGFVFLGNRAFRGWSIQLLLLALLVPFGAVLIDLDARIRRRGVSVLPAFRALRRRIGFWAYAGMAVAVAALAGVFAAGRPGKTLATGDPSLRQWPILGLVLLGAAVLAGWLVARMRLLPRRPVTAEEELSGQLAGLAGVLVSAIILAFANPYSLVFVAPSVLAWVWLPQLRSAPRWVRDIVFGAGLVAPVVVLVVLAAQLDLGARTPLYAVSLATAGAIPWAETLAFLVWAAAAAQLGAVESGRYAPGRESG